MTFFSHYYPPCLLFHRLTGAHLPSREALSCLLGSPARRQFLVHKEADEANRDDEDDAEDENHTSLPSGPVRALGDVRERLARDNGVDDGHVCDGGRKSWGIW